MILLKKAFPVLVGAFIIAACITTGGCMIRMPGNSYSGALPPLSEQEQRMSRDMKRHVTRLAAEIGERNVWRYDALNSSARYITEELEKMRYEVGFQDYWINEKRVSNLVAEVRGSSHPEQIVILGAHYDSVAGTAGANDNASGVAALLELARLMAGTKPDRTLRFVAFVNEEPPFFQTDLMGSRVYAKGCRERKEQIVAMLSLETMGFYSDAKKSQRYPFPFSLMYPDTGNFIAFVGNRDSAPLIKKSLQLFRTHGAFPSEGAALPASITGIGWSDHWSFWQEGYPGLMVTDTAPFRYPYYHTADDTPDKVDFQRLARVTAGLAKVVEGLAAGTH